MKFFSNLWDKVTGTEKVKVRARNKKGHYVADDKLTPDVTGPKRFWVARSSASILKLIAFLASFVECDGTSSSRLYENKDAFLYLSFVYLITFYIASGVWE